MLIYLSYPKSGRTWLRVMVNRYLDAKLGLGLVHGNLFEVEKRLQDSPLQMEWTHLTAAMLLQRHYFGMNMQLPQAVAGVPVVLVVRNLYATLCSAYYHARYRIEVFQGEPGAFVRDPRFGVMKIVAFYNMLPSLMELLGELHTINYDAMRANPAAALKAALQPVVSPIDESLVHTIAAATTLDWMRDQARRPQYHGTPMADYHPEDPKFRAIKFAGHRRYRELFSPSDLDYIAQVIDLTLLEPDRPYLQGLLHPPPTDPPAKAKPREDARLAIPAA